MGKTVEEVAILYARAYYRAQGITAVGLDEHEPLVRAIAAAIREDRAAPVSEAEKTLVAKLVCKGACMPPMTFGLNCAICKVKIEQGIAALSAARKARTE